MIGQTYLERGRPVVVRIRWRETGEPCTVLIRREGGTQVVRPFCGLRRASPTAHHHSISSEDYVSARDGAAIACLAVSGAASRNVANTVWSSIHRTSHIRSISSRSQRKRQASTAPRARIALSSGRLIAAPKRCSLSIVHGSHEVLPDNWIAAGRTLLRSDKRLIANLRSLRASVCPPRVQCRDWHFGFTDSANNRPLTRDYASNFCDMPLTRVSFSYFCSRLFTFVIRLGLLRAAVANNACDVAEAA